MTITGYTRGRHELGEAGPIAGNVDTVYRSVDVVQHFRRMASLEVH